MAITALAVNQNVHIINRILLPANVLTGFRHLDGKASLTGTKKHSNCICLLADKNVGIEGALLLARENHTPETQESHTHHGRKPMRSYSACMRAELCRRHRVVPRSQLPRLPEEERL